jgi:asparagine N-glycosylation enzyme membrane subunit Stt3
MENLSVQLIILMIIAAYVFFIIVMIKNIKKGLGTKINIIIATGLSLLIGLLIFAFILDKVNPGLSYKYHSLFSVLLCGGFFILGCFALVCRVIYERKKRNS